MKSQKRPSVENSSDSEDNIPLKRLQTSQYFKKSAVRDNNESSSESDIENYLQPANKIDLSSTFFQPPKGNAEPRKIEQNRFSQSSRLSDSSDEDSDTEKPIMSDKPAPPLPPVRVDAMKLIFGKSDEYTIKFEAAREQVAKYNEKKKAEEESSKNKNEDISNLLFAGEVKQLTLEDIKPEDLHSSDFESSDEDWEEIKTHDKEESVIPKGNVEVVLNNMPDCIRQKKKVDLLAAMKRRLNRIKKEHQVWLHKVHLLCLIAHGNFLNSTINNTNILGFALSLLPSDKCYPADRTDLNYLEQIVQWYKRTIYLIEKDTLKNMDLLSALQLQINKKEAYNKKMLVLIFVAVMRALGIQCRLVLNLIVEPLRPPAGELHSLSAREPKLKPGTSKEGAVKIVLANKSKSKLNISVKQHAIKAQDNLPSTSQKTKTKVSKLNNNKIKADSMTAKLLKQSKSLRSKKKETISQIDGLDESSDDDLLQLDGIDDKKSKKAPKSKPNLRKLKSPKKIGARKKYSSNSPNSEDDFSSSPTKSASSTFKKLVNAKQLDVKNDIVTLLKGRISEQKQIDRSRLVKKRSSCPDDDTDSDYMPEPIKKKHHNSDSDIEHFALKPKVKQRIKVKRNPPGKLMPSESDSLMKKKGFDVWVEVFLEAEEKWISADIVKGQVHCVSEIFSRATHPVCYILAWNNDNTLKDVTRRYCKNFNTVTRKLRVEPKWWEQTLKPFRSKPTFRDKEEDTDLYRQQLDQPLPTSINEYKNHPLYALKRHLLKFEAIYPPDQAPLGFVKGEAVYPRNSVYVCRSREIWVKEARVVKPGEQPYKIVKARPKWDKLSNKVVNDLMLEIFGEWQTAEYVPPTAENGVVPRNEYGNVELFKPSMLPKGTVHLKLPGLNKICRKMDIDCASAIVGFDFHGGWSHPTYDGFVVCEEFADKLIVAWELDREEQARKENEKIENEVFSNWKKLIKGMIIKQRLKVKYNFEGATTSKKKLERENAKNTVAESERE